MKDLLITHTDLDGISPIILMNLTGREFEYKSIEIWEVENTITELIANDLNTYENIYITDLTLPNEIYNAINSIDGITDKIHVFDHHETHLYASIYPYTTIEVKLNNRLTCGTELFYNYLIKLYPSLNTPLIRHYVDIVRECDTWDFIDKEYAQRIGSLPFLYGKKDYIKSITKRLKKDKEKFELTAFEKRYCKIKEEELTRYLQNKETKMEKYVIANHKVGIVFAEMHRSELGNYLSANNPDLDLIIIISACERVSYRTTHDDVACNEFAALFSGGGHQKASGSQMSEEDRFSIIKNYFKDVKRLENEEN